MLASCSAKPIDTDDSGSIALVEEFFAHLEGGEAAQAAALTSMEFDDEFIDNDFYRASAALPSDMRIVNTSGYDSGGFEANVSYVTNDPDHPSTLDVRVRHDDDDNLTIASWDGSTVVHTSPSLFPGTLTVNATLDIDMTEGRTLTLLPAAYRAEYSDPGRLTHFVGQDSEFIANIPYSGDGPRLNATPALLPEVSDGVLAAIEDYQAACAEEGFVGSSCPNELVEYVGTALDSSVTAEWYTRPGPEIVYENGEFRATNDYQVELSSWEPGSIIDVTYSGVVSRDEGGDIVVTLED